MSERTEQLRPRVKVKVENYRLTKAIDEEAGVVDAVVSTEKQDRDGDIVRVSGWELGNFLKHPLLLADHNYYSVESVIGRWTSMKVVGKQLRGTAEYFIDDTPRNEKAERAFALAKRNLAAFSVGFIPDYEKAEVLDNDGWWPNFEFDGQELLEVSHVTVPANPDALQRMKTLELHPAIEETIDAILATQGPQTEDNDTMIDQVVDRLRGELREMVDEAVKAENLLTSEPGSEEATNELAEVVAGW